MKEIMLDCGIWYMNGYSIEGDKDTGYIVCSDIDNKTVYENDSFEECLVWVWNS